MTDQTSTAPVGANPALPPPPAANGADPGLPSVAANHAEAGRPAVGPKQAFAEAMLNPKRREQLRQMYEETTESYRSMGKKLGLPFREIGKFAKHQGWTRRPDAPKKCVRKTDGHPPKKRRRPAEENDGQSPVNRKRLAASMDDAEAVKSRLIRAVDRQIVKIDTRVRKKEATVEEKDARTLGTLAKTLQTLIALDGDAGAKLQQPEPLDRDALRAALARRFSIWAEQGSRSG